MKRAAWRLASLGLVSFLLWAPGARAAEVSLGLQLALARGAPEQTHAVWVFFQDKGAPTALRTAEARATLSTRSIARRARRGTISALTTAEDLLLAPQYVQAIRATVTRVRHESRWLNAMSVEATARQVRALSALPFVRRVEQVRGYRRREETIEPLARESASHQTRDATGLDYGLSLSQLAQINVPAAHKRGLHGEGVVIAVFDAGFDALSHEVFSQLSILARHDFVNGDDDVGDGADRGRGDHGTATLSVLAGFRDGILIGPAYAAGFLLAKTEDSGTETPVEEDNWAAAAEWAEALGADVISSSLGYLEYDTPNTSYTFQDMDGRTAISTRAADLAAERGVVVVNSAGNAGFNPEHNTLGAPADGLRVLAIGAVDPLGARAGFSSVGPTADGRTKPDLAALGVAVVVARPGSASQYGLASGTSFSCPLSAGAIALLLQAHPTYSVDQVIDVMRSTAGQSRSPDNLLGWGIVNVLAAIDAPEPAP